MSTALAIIIIIGWISAGALGVALAAKRDGYLPGLGLSITLTGPIVLILVMMLYLCERIDREREIWRAKEQG